MKIEDLPQFRPLEKIPKGGMTDLYICVDSEGNRCVVRFVREQFRKDRSIIKSFKSGVAHLKELDHPNIIKVKEDGVCKRVPYMVIEYHESHNLRECILQQSSLIETHSLIFVRKLAAALSYVHSKGYLHMDLKPENILITDDCGLLLIDFDLSIKHKSSKPTKLKVIPGTPTYLAPETLRNQLADERAEVFAFGVVAYELLCHHKPFEANSVTEYKRAVADPKIKAYPIHEHKKDISRKLESIILKCLEKRPLERYPSMALILRDLDALL